MGRYVYWFQKLKESGLEVLGPAVEMALGENPHYEKVIVNAVVKGGYEAMASGQVRGLGEKLAEYVGESRVGLQ